MGADFLMARVRLAVPEQEARDRLAAVPSSELITIYNQLFSYDEDEAEDEVAENIRRMAYEAIDNAYHGSRESAVFDFDGALWAITAGPSWGDSPTDDFDRFVLLDELGVTQ